MVAYNDYNGYFDSLGSTEPLNRKENTSLFRSIEHSVQDLMSCVEEEKLNEMRKAEIICNIAQTLEQIYLNSDMDYLVETIASSVCHIVTKKVKSVSPRYIYQILQKRFKDRYVRGNSIMSNDRKLQVFSQANVETKDLTLSMSDITDRLSELSEHIEDIEITNINELIAWLAQIHTLSHKFVNKADSIARIYHRNDEMVEQSQVVDTGEERESNSPETGGVVSEYYKVLGQYIDMLMKIRENVFYFPPSPELDIKLKESLELEMELLKPSIDMKYKRSIAQLDETVEFSRRQSLNAASSIMSEKALVKRKDSFNSYIEKIHKMTSDQIDARRGYISIIRKKMKQYSPHILFHLMWYEGADELNHKLSFGRFARGNSDFHKQDQNS